MDALMDYVRQPSDAEVPIKMAAEDTALTALLGTVVQIDLTKDVSVPDDGERMLLVGQQLLIDSDEAYITAAEVMKVCAARVKQHNAGKWARLKTLVNSIHDLIMAELKNLTGNYITARDLLETKMAAYDRSKISATEQARAAIKESGEALQSELLGKATQLKREGDLQGARELQAQAGAVVTDVVLAPTTVSVPGISKRREWKAEFITGGGETVSGEMTLLIAIAEGRVKMMQTVKTPKKGFQDKPLVTFDMSVLNYFARTMPGELGAKFPGVKAVQSLDFSVRSED
jgi:hypothetical protein